MIHWFFLEVAVMRIIGVIPARYGSTRFPGKPLAPILGKPMIQWVYQRALLATGLDDLYIATDDDRIAEAARSFGGQVVMTPPDCPTGTDRVWSAVRERACDAVLNIQGDEPALDPRSVEALTTLLRDHPDLPMATLVAPFASRRNFEDPNAVKVVLGREGRCLYFSRSPIPHFRDGSIRPDLIWRHVGLYGYRKDFLEEYTSWPAGNLEAAESLEQLRALERGVEIRAAVIPDIGCAVDVPEDIPRAEAALRGLGAG